MSDKEQLARGRQFVESRCEPTAMLDRLAMVVYFRQQREFVARRGRCNALVEVMHPDHVAEARARQQATVHEHE